MLNLGENLKVVQSSQSFGYRAFFSKNLLLALGQEFCLVIAQSDSYGKFLDISCPIALDLKISAFKAT